LLIGNHFDIQGQFDLDRKYPKTIEVIFWTWTIPIPSLKFLGQSVL
jgi:hypothetical protein